MHQRVNVGVFASPERVAANVGRVVAHLGSVGVPVPVPVAAVDAGCDAFARDREGGLWRAYHYVDGTTVSRFLTLAQAGQAAGAFARLAAALEGLPGPPLIEPIRGFHDFDARLGAFERAVAADAVGRAADCRQEIAAVRAASTLVTELSGAHAAGRLPVRTVHNDAKADNLVFGDDGTVVAVLDLDTVAPGTVLFDVGDLVRSGAATSSEDGDPAEVDVDAQVAAAIVAAYAEAVPGWLTDGERELLPLAGPLMTFEASLRFLTDHLDGDRYFRVDAPGRNLARARAQLALLDRLQAMRQ
ncbi:MAG: hypothetical protein QOD63_2029 [Actinomycetota bacterium]|nr:hypothetical protein [Actinomycetota bacterium]